MHYRKTAPVVSCRIEARSGLRMMPTFPRSSLSFRTAGFPQHGWKVGFPSGTFLDRRQLKPAPGVRCPRPVCIRPSCTSESTRLSRTVSGHRLDCAPPWRDITPPPEVLARVRVIVSRPALLRLQDAVRVCSPRRASPTRRGRVCDADPLFERLINKCGRCLLQRADIATAVVLL